MNLKSFLIRFIIALIFGPLILLTVYYGKYYLLTFVILIVLISLKEFFDLALKKDTIGQFLIAGTGSIAIVLSLYFYAANATITFLLLTIIAILFKELYQKTGSAILNVSVTSFGVLYFAFMTGSFLLLRELPLQKGLDYYFAGGWFIMLILATWLCDTAAYVIGSYFGKNKLIKRISPNKTIEGTLAGLVFAIIGAWICHIWFIHGLQLKDSLIIGFIIGSFGQYGDLFESMFKRDADVKDSSHLIPGHGGIMDRFDSLLVSTPVVYLYLNYYAL
ncbi:phosphatidate cytidylyltransferase [candidate division KSB1 bacterium]|nr:phosphatidate cytidylyltransferase [candidate division KSB1 bacterium]